jgi:transposase-like protein
MRSRQPAAAAMDTDITQFPEPSSWSTLRSMEIDSVCPYCGEPMAFWVDEGSGSHQRYIEDCAVCCRPIEIEVSRGEDDDQPHLYVHRDDD